MLQYWAEVQTYTAADHANIRRQKCGGLTDCPTNYFLPSIFPYVVKFINELLTLMITGDECAGLKC